MESTSTSSFSGLDGGDRKVLKRKKIIIECESHKRLLKRWESAVLKTELRKPNKEDLKQAPEAVQKSYKKYHKLLKYLEATSSADSTNSLRNRKTGLTPNKIFDKSAHRSSTNHENIIPPSRAVPSTSNAVSNREDLAKGTGGYSRFTERINSVVNLISKEFITKPHRVITVSDQESGEQVSRTALIPTRVFDTKVTCREEQDLPLVKRIEKEKSPPRQLNPVSALRISPSQISSKTIAKKAEGPPPQSLKQVDFGWLDRCGNELDDPNEPDPLKSLSESKTIDDFTTSCNGKEQQIPEELETSTKPTKTRKKTAKAKKDLESKLANGKINENFVRIDITKKVFVRGRKKISGAKVKRNGWKQRKAAASREEQLQKLICRKCGESGHFAKFCMKGSIEEEEQVPDDVNNSPFPTLEEVAKMINGKIQTNRVNIYDPPNVAEAIQTNELPVHMSNPVLLRAGAKLVPPYFGYDLGSVKASQEEQDAILDGTLKKFGYTEFRPGQREAISRILKGLSTLVILSTGAGKSLCYQLPAYLYAIKNPGALAICVSPLVSLMQDQVTGLQTFFEADCLHSNMSTVQRDKVLERVRSKKLHVLLVSPEAVCGGLFGLLKGGSELPPISFACVDEAHCVSQWSHNFRPSYLQLCKILREKLNVSTILGLTATATTTTAISICDHLNVDPSTTIRGEIVPNNLDLSVSRDTNREEGLLGLLKSNRFRDCDSVIIYCTRRDECERIAALIRTNLQSIQGFSGVTKTNLRQRVSNACEAYHAGMTAGRRRLVQQQFMSGKIRIVVATVAFGMGIDKSDIRAVIHYNMPKTFESYVQEIGRAGRDGLPAHCHLFLDNVKGKDLNELRRHVYSNSVDRATLRKLLGKIFKPCKCGRIESLSQVDQDISVGSKNHPKKCPGHEVSFSVEGTINELDLAQENILTLLCYLELDKERKWIELLPLVYETCKIHSYAGPKLLKAAALKCPPLAAAIALKREKKKFKESESYLEFNVIEVASTLGWDSGIVKRELKNLEWSGTNYDEAGSANRFRKSGIMVEFSDLAFHVNSIGDLSDEDADVALEYLYSHNQEQERGQLYQLNRVYQALRSVSHPTIDTASETCDKEKSDMLKTFIYNYFTQSLVGVPSDWKVEVSLDGEKEDEIRRDIRNLLASQKDVLFTGRAVAKILQGIPSPCFPADIWGRQRAFWRKHLEVDFKFINQVAGQEVTRRQ